MEPRPKIGFTRQVIAALLLMVSVVTVPVGIGLLALGLEGKLADAERSLNVEAGLVLFGWCLTPLLTMLAVVVGPQMIKKIRFSIRDLLWLTLLVGVLMGWWIDRQNLSAKYERDKNPAYHYFEMKKQFDAQQRKAAAEREANGK
jgi:hypothetical protein